MRKAGFCIALGALLAFPAIGFSQTTQPTSTMVELHGKVWEPVSPQASTAPVFDPTLDEVESLLEAGNNTSARKLMIHWLKTHKDSPVRDRGVFLMGEADFRYGNRILAFYNFDELMDLYPDTPYFYRALTRQYDIADAYLNGYKRRFLGVPMFSAEEEAIEMLYRIQQRSPGSPLAQKALLRTADYYYSTADYDLASDAYAVYIHDYPRSDDIPRVKLRRAFASLAMFRGPRFDATPIINAREQLMEMIQQYPKLAEEENLSTMIVRIDDTLARKLYLTADFYKRTHEPKSAVYVWRYLIETYPYSKEAEQARNSLARMPASALEPLQPLVIPAGSPAQPSASSPVGDAR